MANRTEENQNIAQEKRMLFARNLKRARIEADYSQRDVAKRADLSQAFVSDVEKGKSPLSLDNACILAKAVGKSICILLCSDK